MRFLVFGTGGAGGFFGGRLANAGEDVTFIARGEHLRALRDHGLRIDTPTGEIVIRPAQATDDVTGVGEVDAILVGVKTWQVTEAALALRPMVGSRACVVPLQNGVEAASQLAAVLGSQHVLGGLCGTFSMVSAPGRIRNIGGTSYVKFGELDNRSSERTEQLRRAFERAGVSVEVPPDIQKAMWEKFLLVVSLGGAGAVTRAPVGVMRTVPETRRLLERCMEEVLAVARQRHVAFADAVVTDTLAFVDSMPPGATTSLQRDIAESRPSELEAWNGAVVRLGREHGVPTPTHEFIYGSLLPLELRARSKLAFPE